MSKLTALTLKELQGRVDQVTDALMKAPASGKRALSLEKARLLKEIKARESIGSVKFPDPTIIPHVFMNVELTRPASSELASYMKLLLEHCPDALKYIYNACQKYCEHGGAPKMTFVKWKRKLELDLEKEYASTK